MRIIISSCFFLLSSLTFASTPAQIHQKTQAFIHRIAPLAIKADNVILANRKRLLDYYALYKQGEQLGTPRWEWMAGLANYYGMKSPDFTKKTTWKTLLRRVNVIPPSLVIAQAAIESAWGTSRFAKEANNYFGQHCFKTGCGLMPKRRPKGERVLVEKFDSPYASVQSYMHNLNTHYNYDKFRALREKRVQEGEPLTGYTLAKGLDTYSELDGYVKYVRLVIKKHHLAQYDKGF